MSSKGSRQILTAIGAAIIMSLSLMTPAHAQVSSATQRESMLNAGEIVRHASAVNLAAVLKAAQASTSVAGAASTMAAAVVTVVRGDTLSKIAARQCGSRVSWRNIWAQNPSIRNPNLIYPGQRINVSCVRTTERASRSSSPSSSTSAPSGSIATVLNHARAQVGKPYRWAASGPGSYDCSGLVLASYARIGVRLPHQSSAMLAYGRKVSRADLRPGDLVWPRLGHVSLYLGDGMVVEASSSQGRIVIRKMWGFYTARRLV